MDKIQNDQAFMAEALRLAEKGLYTTRNNPRVGCVIVKDGDIVGRGFHLSSGNPHAEVNALQSCSNSLQSIVYVSLEPCSHHGKTPPCVEALVEAKVARVVCAIKDPNPLVNGQGLEYLQNHGIKTDTDILVHEASELNKGFIMRMRENRPYITVKSAISLDGKTALASGESKWISSEESRLDVQKLRAKSCAIMTGIDTVLADDPSLNVRLTKNDLNIESDVKQPKRIILDTHLRIPTNAKILNEPENVIIYTCVAESEIPTELKSINVEIVNLKYADKVDLKSVMSDLAKREINEVLVEAGSTLVGNLFDHQLVDEIIMYIAPHLMGDAGFGLAKLTAIQSMKDRINLEIIQLRKIGNDIKLQLKPNY